MFNKFGYLSILPEGYGQAQSVIFKFISLSKRINTLDAFDYTGSRIHTNISILLKYLIYQ